MILSYVGVTLNVVEGRFLFKFKYCEEKVQKNGVHGERGMFEMKG